MAVQLGLMFDFSLAAAALLAFCCGPRIGGRLGKGLKVLLSGVVVFGTAHAIEALLYWFFQADPLVNAIAYRLLLASAFCFILIGSIMMRRAFEE